MLNHVGQSLGDWHGVNTLERKNFSNEIQKPKKAYFFKTKVSTLEKKEFHLVSENNLYKVGIPAQRVLRSLRPQ